MKELDQNFNKLDINDNKDTKDHSKQETKAPLF